MHPDQFADTFKAAPVYAPLRGQFFAYAVLGFASVLCAEAFDSLEPAPYAAYYFGAVNTAISPRYWNLLVVLGLLLLCLLFPVRVLRPRLPSLAAVAGVLMPAARQIMAFAFALGSVSAGILLALLLSGRLDSPALQAWGELMFGGHPVIAWLLLLMANALLGLAGQILTQPEHPLWLRLLAMPGRYVWPVYGLFAVLVLALLVGQQ